ncbi:MAG: ribonuclease P protein component [Candidatus Rokubacteria bacterium]|nr:ribonuclease P protein component [Candidatus Rokubacteria bacterium]
MGLPRSERLTRREEFQAVFQRGRRVDRPSLVVLWRRWDGPRRVGFAVSHQVRGAVRRNRARRRLREAYRANREALSSGVQLVCVARAVAAGGPFHAVHRDMKEALAAVARHLRATAGG